MDEKTTPSQRGSVPRKAGLSLTKGKRWLMLIGCTALAIVVATQFLAVKHVFAANDPVYSGDTSQPRIAITFDDGPSPETPKVLDTLAQYQVKATFFEIGSNVDSYPDYSRRVVAEGHVLGNHTWEHISLSDASDAEINRQLSLTSDKLASVTGVRPTLLRPPFGAFNQNVLDIAASYGLKTIMWNTDASDWTDPGVDSIVSGIVNNTKNGSIILLHDGYGRSQTAAALPSILQQLKAKGFQFVTVPQLLGIDSITPTPTNPVSPTPTATNPVSPTPTPTGSTTTLKPTEDRDNYATNVGNDPSINASIYQVAYLKFNLSSLSANVAHATLRLYRPYATDSVTVTAYQVNDDSWSENNNALPDIGSQINSTNFTGNGYVEIDVTSFIAAQKSGDGVATIAIKASSTFWTSFNSKDNATNQPELVVQN